MERVLFLTNIDHGASESMSQLMADNGYEVLIRRTAEEWQQDPEARSISLVIISQEVPIDYLNTCRIIRSQSSVPIIVLSNRSDTVDMVVALEIGADDFIAVPFERLELVARIRALLRRSAAGARLRLTEISASTSEQIVIGPLRIDCGFQDAFVQGQPVGLTNLEFRLLFHFITHQEELISKQEIFSKIWGYDITTNTHSLSTYIHLLKKKLRAHGVWLPIESFPKVGYRLGPATVINLFPVGQAEGAG